MNFFVGLVVCIVGFVLVVNGLVLLGRYIQNNDEDHDRTKSDIQLGLEYISALFVFLAFLVILYWGVYGILSSLGSWVLNVFG